MSVAKKMTAEDHKQGWSVCECGKYAYVFRSSVLAKLPQGYNGELCKECSLWMCAVDKLPKEEEKC